MADPTNGPDVPGESSPSTDLVAPIARPASTAVMSAEQFDSTWRMAKALAFSGSFKDIGKGEGEKALARILLGADLGMSPTQALMGIDIVKGNPQIRGVALGRMIRNSARRPLPTGESYDYAVLDRGFEPGQEFAVVALYRRDDDGNWPWVEGDEGVTFPTSIGPVTIKTGERLPEAVEAFKLDQAKKRNLIKTDGAWGTQPEVMVVWRALSQLVRFYAPDAIGGVPVYTEADSFEDRSTIGGGEGSGEGPGWGEIAEEQVAQISAVIERAKRLGHAGLSDEPSIQMRLLGQPQSAVEGWLTSAKEALDAIEATQEPPDAEVVPDDSEPMPKAPENREERVADLRATADALREEAQGDEEADREADAAQKRALADELDAKADEFAGTLL